MRVQLPLFGFYYATNGRRKVRMFKVHMFQFSQTQATSATIAVNRLEKIRSTLDKLGTELDDHGDGQCSGCTQCLVAEDVFMISRIVDDALTRTQELLDHHT